MTFPCIFIYQHYAIVNDPIPLFFISFQTSKYSPHIAYSRLVSFHVLAFTNIDKLESLRQLVSKFILDKIHLRNLKFDELVPWANNIIFYPQ